MSTPSDPQIEIAIEEYNDGFAIIVNDKRFLIFQEDTKEKLVEVFKSLGYQNVTHNHVY